MAATATVPVTITPEAAARVAELGMQKELEQMLEHTRQTVPGLSAITVVLALPYDTGDETSITIEALRSDPWKPEDRTEWNWDTWLTETFPPRVCQYFVMMTLYEEAAVAMIQP